MKDFHKRSKYRKAQKIITHKIICGEFRTHDLVEAGDVTISFSNEGQHDFDGPERPTDRKKRVDAGLNSSVNNHQHASVNLSDPGATISIDDQLNKSIDRPFEPIPDILYTSSTHQTPSRLRPTTHHVPNRLAFANPKVKFGARNLKPSLP